MNYTVNNQLRTSILFDGTAEARLADILAIMDTHTFGKREAAKIVGGIGRLIRLIEENKIRSDKEEYRYRFESCITHTQREGAVHPYKRSHVRDFKAVKQRAIC